MIVFDFGICFCILLDNTNLYKYKCKYKYLYFTSIFLRQITLADSYRSIIVYNIYKSYLQTETVSVYN